MSKCKTCFKDSKEHSQKLWLQHQKNESCQFCQKGSREHSERLWEMHHATIQEALRTTRHKKLWMMRLGLGPNCRAVLDNNFRWDGDMNPADFLHPVYMSCTECNLYLGNIEEKNADVLDGMCLKCFGEMTDQKNGYGE